MTPEEIALRASLAFDATPIRHPGRHEVVEAVFSRGNERIPVVVKKIRLDARQVRGVAKGLRSLATARALLKRGIRTPEPLAAEVVGDESWYVARKLEEASQIRAWFLHRNDPFAPAPLLSFSFEDIVRCLGVLARRLHDSGVFFRDFTDGNVLVTDDGGTLALWLVDLDRAVVTDVPLGPLRRYRDLARPGLDRSADLNLLLLSYFHPAPVPLSARVAVFALRRRIVAWDRFKVLVRPWRS